MTCRHRVGLRLSAAGLALLLLVCSAVSIAEGAEDALNNALRRIDAASSLTIDVHIALRQNDEMKASGSIRCQSDGQRDYISATVTDRNGFVRDIEISTEDGTRVVRAGDHYYSMPIGEEEKAERASSTHKSITIDQLRKGLRKLFGAAADNMEVSDTGLSLHITRQEVPFSRNLALGLADGFVLKDNQEDVHWPAQLTTFAVLHGIREDAVSAETTNGDPFELALGYALHIDHVDLEIIMEDANIRRLKLGIGVGGRKSKDVSLITELDMDIHFTGINETIPGTVDISGVEMSPLDD